MARQAECLGKEAAPGEGETEQAKLLVNELTAKLEKTQIDLAKEKEEEESKLKETELEATEVKEMKAKLAESLREAKEVTGEEKMLRKRVKDQKTELNNLETELNKVKVVVERASDDNSKLVEENEILASTLSNLEAEADAVKRKKLNFGEELNQMNQAQMEKMKLAAEKKADLLSEVEEVQKKASQADQENEKLLKELQEREKILKEKKRQLEEKKKDLERLPTAACSNKSQNPAFTPASRPRLLNSTIFNKLKDGSKRPALKTNAERVKLGTSSSNMTPKSTKPAPSGSARPPSASPSLKDFRESRANFAEKNATSKKSVFDFGSSSDETQAGGGQLPTSNKNPFTTPRKEKSGVPTTPINSGKPQPLESQARSGPTLFLGQNQGKNKEQAVEKKSGPSPSSLVARVSDSDMESSN